MAEENHNDTPPAEDYLPALNTPRSWVKVVLIFAGLVLVNVVAFLVSYGFGAIITLPITIFLAFLLLRDIVPRHRLPPGRPPRGIAT
jgi:hypothetical protein